MRKKTHTKTHLKEQIKRLKHRTTMEEIDTIM
jgi:hypothetical protein